MEWDRKIESRDESVHIQFQAYVTLCGQRANLLVGAIFPFARQVRENKVGCLFKNHFTFSPENVVLAEEYHTLFITYSPLNNVIYSISEKLYYIIIMTCAIL